MTAYSNYRPKQVINQYGEKEYWVIAGTSLNSDAQVKIAKVPHWIAYPNAVAIAIAEGLNRNTKLQLVDLV